MARYIVGDASDIPVGSMKLCEADGESIVVYHLEDGFYATQNRCTHVFAPLHKGKIVNGCQIQCPFHRARFDIRTGEVAQWANFPMGVQLLNILRKEKALKTYPVAEDTGILSVEI
jgi:3-phenylpropionate/trans-cinnamate dioxygenase ferredoxin subunit